MNECLFRDWLEVSLYNTYEEILITWSVFHMQPLSGSGHHVVHSWWLLAVVLVFVKIILG